MAEEIANTTRDELEKSLTDKEKKFCYCYIVHLNATKAALEAGYSENSARQIGSENLSKLDIKTFISLIRENIEEITEITKIRQLMEFKKLAYSNISHLHDTWIELSDWENIKAENPDALDSIESIETKTEYKTYQTDGDPEMDIEIKYVKIKLYSKLTALSEINKMMGYNAPVKGELTGKNGEPLIPKRVSIEFGDPDNE